MDGLQISPKVVLPRSLAVTIIAERDRPPGPILCSLVAVVYATLTIKNDDNVDDDDGGCGGGGVDDGNDDDGGGHAPLSIYWHGSYSVLPAMR